MSDRDKTKEQLIAELTRLRAQLAARESQSNGYEPGAPAPAAYPPLASPQTSPDSPAVREQPAPPAPPHQARASADATSARLRALQAVMESALSHLDLQELLRQILGRLLETLQVDNAAILLVSEDGRDLIVYSARGPEEEVIGTARIPMGRGVAGRIAASRQPMIVDELRAVDVANPVLREKLRSLVGAPLMIEDRVIGVLHVDSVHPHHFTQEDAHLLLLIADRVALAIEHAQLYEAERQARAEAEQAQRRLAFLAEANSLLLASLDYAQALAGITGLVVPRLADWCYVDILTGEGGIERQDVAHVQPELEARLRQLQAPPPLLGQPSLLRKLRSGQSVLISEITDEQLAAATTDPQVLQVWRAAAPHTLIAVPFRIRSRTVGTLALLLCDPERHFSAPDLALAEELAHRTAAAIDNVRLYQESQAALRQVATIAAQQREQAATLTTILEALPDGVFVCDATGHIVHVNAAGARLVGHSAGQLRQPLKNFQAAGMLCDPDGTPLPLDEYPLAQALRGITRTDFRVLVRRSSGEEVHVLSSFAPIRNEAGDIVGAVATSSDISELTRLEQQKDEFLSIASHELKTPLTTLKILSQLLYRRLAPTGHMEAEQAARMDRAIGRMERLVNDLLDVSRIESGRLALRTERMDLVALCRQIAEEQMAANERTITLELPRGEVSVMADPERIGQVLTNLLSNALKYSLAERPITLRLAVRTREAIVCVRDHGPGIPAEALPHLFERFYRVPGMQVQSGSGVGLGLGLYISHEIIERHGGRIWAESSVGEGSTFCFALPLAG
jgi:PAS domain S-box-containing protein